MFPLILSFTFWRLILLVGKQIFQPLLLHWIFYLVHTYMYIERDRDGNRDRYGNRDKDIGGDRNGDGDGDRDGDRDKNIGDGDEDGDGDFADFASHDKLYICFTILRNHIHHSQRNSTLLSWYRNSLFNFHVWHSQLYCTQSRKILMHTIFTCVGMISLYEKQKDVFGKRRLYCIKCFVFAQNGTLDAKKLV